MFKVLYKCVHFTFWCSKILQARLQQYVNWELPDVQAGFRKGRGAREQIANIHWIMGIPEKASTSALLTLLKPLTVWITTNCGKFLKRREYQITLPVSWETCMQVKKQQLELDRKQWLIIGKEVRQSCILSPWLFNFYAEYIMPNARLGETQTGIKISRRNINNLRYADDTTLIAESEEKINNLLLKVK